MSLSEYEQWLESWLGRLVRVLKSTASIYICGDWRSSTAIHRVVDRLFIVRNRITWEREKGRGAKTNWKNCSEDIWFCTVSNDYTFNVEDVKLKRRVMAPYTDDQGELQDWSESENGRFRLTYPSNIWTDLTVPFWSMPENTDHPTQKPEKMLAKIILASSNKGDVVLDPFLGSGTTSVVAKKLGRRYIGIEIDEFYCCLAERQLETVERDQSIQGYTDGIFWERNTSADQNGHEPLPPQSKNSQPMLFQPGSLGLGVVIEKRLWFLPRMTRISPLCHAWPEVTARVPRQVFDADSNIAHALSFPHAHVPTFPPLQNSLPVV